MTLVPCLFGPSRSLCPLQCVSCIVRDRVCSDLLGAILLTRKSIRQFSQVVARENEPRWLGETRGKGQQFVNQFDGLPFRQASERKHVEQKGVRRYPELFHLEAARIRTDWRKGLGVGVEQQNGPGRLETGNRVSKQTIRRSGPVDQ